VLRPISPNTQAQYAKALARGVSDSEASRKLLRAALKRQAQERGEDPAYAAAVVPPPTYQIKRVREFLPEADALAYEAVARQLPPGLRELALLPLALGLRASSALGLKRVDVGHAVDSEHARAGLLLVLLKRGKEDLIDCRKALGLLEALLAVPKARGRVRLGAPAARAARWEQLGEILSPASPITQYHLFHDLVRSTGRAAELAEDISPHDLRHAFASRMLRDGATIADIQKALGHESPQTTLIYLHADRSRVGQFMRQF
jgi:integrase/recombinase XerD